jgi:septal ring factor EnvC (AmiA/AmiB activator)
MRRTPVAFALVLALFPLRASGRNGGDDRDDARSPSIVAVDAQLEALARSQSDGEQELSRLEPELAKVHARIVTRGRVYVRLARAGLLPVGGGFESLVRHAMTLERTRRTLEKDLRLEQELRSRRTAIATARDRIVRDREALVAQRRALEAERAVMADEERRREAFERAFEGSSTTADRPNTRRGGDYVAVYGGSGVAEPASGGFGAARGRLLFPVLGRAEVRAARRDGAEGPGVEIVSSRGAVVRAAYAGRVAFSDRYGAYGRIVILDHGDHYYTVSGNLGEVDVRVGDELSAGERIGTVGDEGRGPMLYFEVRHGTNTVAPGPWLGL